MTLDEIRYEVSLIRAVRADDEAAHSREDKLFEAVLKGIADGLYADPAAAAREALRSTEIDFGRWCA